MIKDPEYLESADYVVMESTYGDRSHGERPDYVQELVDILRRTFKRHGNVVVPSFAVGRTQEMLYFLRKIKADNLLPEFPDFDVYVDSPLAVQATNIFKEHYVDCYDEETMEQSWNSFGSMEGDDSVFNLLSGPRHYSGLECTDAVRIGKVTGRRAA
mgnify:CR=1 FL=1